MKEWKAAEKEAQKMTRDGAISVNMVTGEASHVSDRAPEQDYSPSGDSTVLARTALHHLDDRRVRKSQKKKRRNRRKAYREGTAANDRPSSRLQFSDEERAAPELQKAIRKSDKAADKLDAARAAIPKKRVLGTERVFDEASGIETELVELLAKMKDFPVTYAGGVGSFEDLELLKKLGNNHVDVTIGSALDLFGGKMKFEDVLAVCRR